MSFLKAEWRKLILVNYVVPKDLLLKFVPNYTELDLWEDRCYISLVGFMFRNTKVLGLKIPGHVNFEEVNLRFYVKHKHKDEMRRGVVFVKEIVPKSMITFVANTVYNENYVTRKMGHKHDIVDGELKVCYSWNEDGQTQQFSVIAEPNSVDFKSESEEEFITEHYWGYASARNNTTNEYEVTHPKWKLYPVKEFNVNVDFGKVYGQEFSVLNSLMPSSVFLAEGSNITVESKNRII